MNALSARKKQIIKIVVMGPGASGKTVLCNRFVKKEFVSCPRATIGSDFYIGTFVFDGEEFSVQFWDTAGQERFGTMDNMLFRRANGVVFVYDVTDESNFEETVRWIEHYRKIFDGDMIIVGNKSDLGEKREVSTLRGYKLASKYGAKFFEVSAKTNASVQEAIDTLLRTAAARMLGKKVPEEILHDPYALAIYEKALQAGKEKDKSIRVNIVGNFRQGKTTLMRRLLGQEIRDITSTNGIVVEQYRCKETNDGTLHYTKADDIDTSEYVQRLVSVAVSGGLIEEEAQVKCLLQQTITGAEISKEPMQTTSEDLAQSTDTKDIINNSLSKSETKEGNQKKSSLLSIEEKDVFAKALKTSQPSLQKEKETVFDIWDFGGQYIFYATHTIFHSKRAIYVLVFDLSVGLNQIVTEDQFPTESESRDMKYFINFWMNSIHSFVGSEDGLLPKVILVGTHKDKLKGTKREKEIYISKYFEEIREMFDGTSLSNHIHFDDFAVDNTNAKDTSVKSLRETIIRIGDEQSETFEIPLKWIQLEKSLLERKHLKLISIKFVLAIDFENEFPLSDKEEVKLFLRYHHAKGTFVYFDEEPISEYVVLDPQYLIDAFKCILTSERFCTNEPELRPLWRMLLTEGRLERQLIDRQWGKPEDKFKMYRENKEILLSFLVKHHIISEAAAFDENTHKSTGLGWFVVPSLLADQSSRTEFHKFLSGKQQTNVRYVISFDCSSIAPTIYHRLVSAAIGKWPIAKAGKKTLIYKDTCVVRLNIDHAGIAEMKNNMIEMTVVSLCPSTGINGEQADNFRRFSEAVITDEFQKLRSAEDIHTKPYTIWFRCNHQSHGLNGSENLNAMKEMENRKFVPCPDLMTHDVNVDKAKEEWFQDNRKIVVIPDNQLTDILLGNISQCIGNNWQLLGLELGLTHVQIEHIVEDHPHSAVMRIYTMLQTWCREDEDKATLRALVETAQRCPQVSVDWDKLRNILDRLH
ncbi:uncharacterized protein LOC123535281 [Mercenaria mercenaria]|uniref:uncharacterized protein LOC123535281 n=1 Tax=Mercenaria mercenaria TaxID=6596 RepID=UPI00234E4989|nr:uncharacterized protein LOC123535281 [Mercenaria mercenaria]XP_053375696.1 uncharacterized protein LOC123535281 [Mercenaria mercenaria]